MMSRTYPYSRPRGIILLVVLSALTFFSLLVAAYLVLSSQARDASFAISTRNIKSTNHRAFIDDALMMLIRGTDDVNSPYFGEDLLSDYYGVRDFIALEVRSGATTTDVNGFIQLPVQDDASITGGLNLVSNAPNTVDDAYSGRVITFTTGNLTGKTFRVLRSLGVASSNYHDLVFERDSTFVAADISVGDKIMMNGIPRNAAGVGFDGTNLNLNASVQPGSSYIPSVGFSNLPLSLQPNHFGHAIDKIAALGPNTLSDFDEPSDVADHNNWFLSFRRDDGTIIPSFHRPAVLNYVLNHADPAVATPSPITYPVSRDIHMSLLRATFRPIPTLRPDTSLPGGTFRLHEKFTGGNASFALRQPLELGTAAQLDQLMKALVKGDWDVDNDSDGKPDSVWIDLGLPVFISPEGKLLKPLVAVMIEDLSGRLNVNAHGNYALLDTNNAGLVLSSSNDLLVGGFAAPYRTLRGLGYGPAEITFPKVGANVLSDLLYSRYFGTNTTSDNLPGIPGADSLHVLTHGYIPNLHQYDSYYGNSLDPFGRTGFGASGSGNITSAGGGVLVTDNTSTTNIEPTSGEFTDNPYEIDPTGRLRGDIVYTADDLESVLRFDDFDGDQLTERLRKSSSLMLATNPALKHALTTISKSDDRPIIYGSSSGSAYGALRSLLPGTLTDAQVKQLIAPELRLGRKLDLNRRFGNGVDDSTAGAPGYGVVDEPSELFLSGVDDDGDGNVDEADETSVETEPFKAYSGATTPTDYVGATADYDFDEPSAVGARQLFARHLYVLMMAVSNGISGAFPAYGDTLATPVPVSDRAAYTSRRLAQWAVNTVDFRDPDSIMTRFSYDPNPFDGWGVAYDINGDGASDRFEGNATALTHPQPSPFVWGVENPELVLKESQAIHDVRVRDTNYDSTNKSKGTGGADDDDTDQVRVPEGSLFFELYCPRQDGSIANGGTLPLSSPLAGGIPRELYSVVPSGSTLTVNLDLGRTVSTYFDSGTGRYGDPSYTASQTPVWRIAISQRHVAAQSPLQQQSTLPDALSFQPSRLDELDNSTTPTNKLPLERFIFFQNYADLATLQNTIAPIPDVNTPYSVYFRQSGGSPFVAPEQYLALAPRVKTNIGSDLFSTGSGPIKPSNQRFEVGANGLAHYNTANTQTTPGVGTNIGLPAAMVMGGFAPSTWTAGRVIGMNVSEPLASATYYQEPTHRYTTAVNTYPDPDAYVELDNAGIPVNGAPLDSPEDMRVQGPIYDLTLDTVGDPLVEDPILGTFKDYRTAFLQRLADPTRGFHPVFNPYITVDQISIDLDIISGEDTANNVTKQGEAPSVPTLEGNYTKGSRQKNGRLPSPLTAQNVLFSYSTSSPNPTAGTPAATSYIEDNFANTFSYLNAGFGAPQTVPNLGRPTVPFAVHNWLNRPFASPMEIMLVPACSPGRLFEEFSITDGMPIPHVYPADPTKNSSDADYAREFLSPSRHLLNFFHSSSSKHGGQPTSELVNIFELVSAYAGFRGEWSAVTPSRIAGTASLSPLYTSPFNLIPKQSPNGRINLNSIQSFSVWAGLMQGHMNQDEFDNPGGGTNATQLSYDVFRLSRRGYTPSAAMEVTNTMPTLPYNYDAAHLNPRFPTEFAGHFAPATSAHYAIKVRGTAPADSELRRRYVDATVARSAGTLLTQDTSGPPATALSPSLVRSSSTENPTFPYMNRDRNPFLRYQSLMRMPNLVTDNSQTYLVRMTLGYFEVDSSNVDSFGAEYNESIGQNKRYKAMFIVDRSIPVGFVPGKDLNARNTVIFERYYP